MPQESESRNREPDDPAGLLRLAAGLMAAGRFAEALARYERALALAPDFAAGHNDCGLSLSALDRPEEAMAHFRRAQALDPNLAAAFYNGGNACMALNRPEDAVAQFAAALARMPALAPAYAGIGAAREAQGRFDEARAAFARAVALAPRVPAFHLALAQTGRFVAGDPRLAALESLRAEAGRLGDFDRACLHFALGKAYDDLRRPWRALAAWNAANAAKRRTFAYDEAASLRRLEKIAETVSAEFLARRRGGGADDERPIFIVGMPRSGTTLVEQILASHPQVYGAGELTDLEMLLRAGAADGVVPEADRMTPDWLAALGRAYAERLAAHVPAGLSPRRIADKMPDNFRFVGLIHLALPKARIVHVRRSPSDTCLSCYSILFGRRQAYSYDLAELGRYYRAYDRLMAHWRAVLPADAWLEVRYENLVGHFDTEARRLVAFCGLDWDERCARFYRTERVVRSASRMQVRRPLYGRAVGRWKAYAGGLAPLFSALGPGLAPRIRFF